MRPRHVLLALIVAAIWGFNFVVIDVGVNEFPPLLFAALRFAVVAIPAVFFVGMPKVQWRWILLISVGVCAGQFGLLFTAIHAGMPAGLASLVLQAQAIFTLVLGSIFLGERIQLRQVLGLAIAFGGIALVGFDLGQGSPLVAFALCIGAAAAWAVGNVGIRKARATNILNMWVWVSLLAPVPLLALSLVFEGPRADLEALRNLSLPGIASLAYIAYISTLVGYGIWGVLMRRYNAGVVAAYALLVPIFGLSSAAVFLDERITPTRIVAGVLIVGGVALTSLRLRRKKAEPVTEPQRDSYATPG
ncbi:EamA family transporter [Tenggerimyces flavus]|uniref:EamA family transporter n=1 Tax=Tenggerimyces flavus TaxID=1708749 RepID=A0ABV7YGZ6_9ACTN|nr:EamA family transporter [Tenggerimyces flavus]MBM7784077.1 O-acetylserine/cysteine efflux transporter [Tenggerimyces flavus]